LVLHCRSWTYLNAAIYHLLKEGRLEEADSFIAADGDCAWWSNWSAGTVVWCN
jgi:hypothetical protein